MSRNVKYAIVGCAVVIALLGGFLSGFVFGNTTNLVSLTTSPPTVLQKETQDIFKLMTREALEPPSETTATIGAINGVLESNGDKYARYLPATEFKDYSEQMNGQFGGIGVVLETKDDNVFVAQVYKGTPAEKAGLKKGDYFYAIEGKQQDTWKTEEIQKLVKGEPGTDVKITMCRPYQKGDTMNIRNPLGVPYDVTITRAVIDVPVTEAKMKGDEVGYVRLFDFTRNSGDAVRKDLEELKKKGAKKFIFDLRDNPGGDLSQAVEVASLFIEEGTIVKIESRVEGTRTMRATGDCSLPSLPLIVLIDENSASASEIVSGAIKDYKRAKLIGMNTFGKGSVQTQMEFGDGAVLFTTAHYLSPKGKVINNVGVAPDIEVSMSLDKQDSDKTDIQLQRALKELEK